MKNKQELAQTLSENLDRVDEALLQQAHQIDTAEKFHALDGKQKKIRFTKDRPVTTFHRATAVAVSLAVALALAFGVFALAQKIPGLWGPDPTNPPLTQPPGTTQTTAPTTEPNYTTMPTDPTVPTSPSDPIESNPSGICGENATWEFDPTTGTLTISGTGEMDASLFATWNNYSHRITTLIIEDGITTIGGFRTLSKLTTVQISDSVHTLLSYAFAGCTQLSSVSLPNSITHISEYAFFGCTALTNITLPTGLLSIDACAFQKCTALVDVSLPEGLLHIGESAFYNCGFQTFTIPSTVTSLDNTVFMSCPNLKYIVIPAGVTHMGSQVLAYNDSLTAIFCEATEPQENWSRSWNSDSKPVYFAHQWTYQDGIPVLNGVGIQGSCGENATWHFRDDTLIISGTGNMFDYTEADPAPWLDYRSSIKHIEVSEGVQSIGDYAFSSLSNLTSVQLSDGLLTIGDYAFQDCWILKTIEIPDSVTAIGQRVLRNCRRMESISLPDGLSELGCYAFDSCYDLKDIVIPGKLTELSEGVFYNCRSLKTVSVPASITAIRKYAFYGCTQLQEITFPDDLQHIGYGAFYNCPYLKSVTIPASLTELEDFAFYGCHFLEEIYFPGDLPDFCVSLFDCVNNDKLFVYYPNGNSTWTKEALDHLRDLFGHRVYFRAIDFIGSTPILPDLDYPNGPCGENANWMFNPDTGTLTIYGTGPMSNFSYAPWGSYQSQITQLIIQDGITAIGGFSSLKKLSTVHIPNSVHTLYKDAFNRCTSLKEVHLPDSISSVGSYAFAYCSLLENINIPANLATVSWGMFTDCSALKTVTLHDGITTIENYAFNRCCSLTQIALPNSVTTIGGDVFKGCTNLQSVTLSNQITMIPNHAFYSCSSLTEIVIPDSVTSIDRYAFNNCTNLQKIVMGSNMESISVEAFYGCSKLQGFVISVDNPHITSDATGPIFNKDKTEILLMAPGYTDVYEVPDGVITIKLWSFRNCALSGVILPDSVTHIEEYAFDNCANMESVILSENLKVIGMRAFMSCKALKEITFPASVEKVDYGAFSGCTGMQSATFLGPYPEFGESVFLKVTGKLYYPPYDPEWIGASELIAVDMEWLPYICPNGHTIQILPGKNATCTEQGLTEGKICTVCNETILIQMTIAANGHKMSFWEQVPSDSSGNLYRRSCENCEYVEEKYMNPEDFPPAGGSCGNGVTWHYADGVLTISGTGYMTHYSSISFSPWFKYSAVISRLVISDGVCSISSYAFVGLIQIREISIPNSVTAIGTNAFYGCTGLTSVTIPDSVTFIYNKAFGNCTNLQSVTMGTGITNISFETFDGCHALSSIRFMGDMPYMEDAFLGLTLTIYYPADNDTWDPSTFASYGSSHTWIPVEITP